MMQMGHKAAIAPSAAPVATSETPILYTARHSATVITKPIPQAFTPDIFNRVMAMISQAIGITANNTWVNILSPFPQPAHRQAFYRSGFYKCTCTCMSSIVNDYFLVSSSYPLEYNK